MLSLCGSPLNLVTIISKEWNLYTSYSTLRIGIIRTSRKLVAEKWLTSGQTGCLQEYGFNAVQLAHCNKNHQGHCSKKFLWQNYEEFKHGKRGFHNWLNIILGQIKLPWINMVTPITNDSLRINLVKTFHFIWPFKSLLTYFYFVWNCTSVLESWFISGSY